MLPKWQSPKFNPVQRDSEHKAIWNNDHQDDNGIEKIVCFFLRRSYFSWVYINIFVSKGQNMKT
jgi:hypothetical protein